jgi:hypothetical protein
MIEIDLLVRADVLYPMPEGLTIIADGEVGSRFMEAIRRWHGTRRLAMW